MLLKHSLLVQIFTVLELTTVKSDVFEAQLLKDLFDDNGYNVFERPVSGPSQAVKVKLGFQLIQIIDLVLSVLLFQDERSQMLDTIAHLNYVWRDYNLQWKPQEYGNIKSLSIPVEKIWKPDVLLYNSADEQFESNFPTNAQIWHNGTVYWNPPAVMKSSCDIDVTFFPFDEQICHLKFGSWTYNGLKLDLDIADNSLDTSAFKPNGEWLLTGTYSNRSTNYYTYTSAPEPYIDIKFYLSLRRRTLFFGFNIILPSLIISSLALLTFYLPPDAGEKISLATMVLMSLTYCLDLVAQMTPITSEAIPLISKFYLCCIVLIAFSSVFAVLVLAYHNVDPDIQMEMKPSILRLLHSRLTTALFVRKPRRKKLGRESIAKKLKAAGERLIDVSRCLEVDEKPSPIIQRKIKISDSAVPLPKHQTVSNKEILKAAFSDIVHLLDDCAEKSLAVKKFSDDATQNIVIANNWKYAAIVVDRICLIFLSVALVTFTFLILFSADYVIA